MVTKIIDELASEDDLTKPLLKTLIFARRIGNQELATWVSRELNGYADGEVLPDYRYARTTVSGVMSQNGRVTGVVSLPLSCFGDNVAEMLMRKKFPESIAMLEDIVKTSRESRYIGKDFAADMLRFLTQEAKRNGCNFIVVSCRQMVAISEVTSINTIIRTKLLELLLKVESEFPKVEASSVDDEAKSKINSTVNVMMGNIYNIHSAGDQNKINTGDKNDFS